MAMLAVMVTTSSLFFTAEYKFYFYGLLWTKIFIILSYFLEWEFNKSLVGDNLVERVECDKNHKLYI